MKRLTGLIPAVPTPMTAAGNVDYDRIPALVEKLIQDDVDAFYVLGSTGEGISLTSAERQQTAEAFMAAISRRRPIIVQVGHTSLGEARQLATHAAQAGADAISATPPSYFRPNNVESLITCMAEIAWGAPNLPFYYYHIPMMTGVTVDMPEFLQRGSERISNLAGLKFTSPAIWEFQRCVEVENGRFDCLYGHDEMLLPALAVGAKGAVGTTYNFALPIYRRVIAAFERGDLPAARVAQSKAIAMIRVLLRRGGLPAFKSMMALTGIDCGPVRAPLVPVSISDQAELREELEAIGFFDELKA